MRPFPLILWLIVLVSVAGAQTAPPEITALRDPYQKNLAQLHTVREQRAVPITTVYLAALERLEKQAPVDAALVSAVTAERERVAAKKEPLESDRRSMPPALLQLRMRYEGDLERSNAPFQQQERLLTRQYIGALDTLQRRLTAQNQIANAAAAHAESLAAAATLPGNSVPKPEGAKTPADSTIRASTVKAAGALDAPLGEKIAAAVAAKGYTRSEKSNQEETTKGWADVPEAGGLLVGFEFFEVGKDHRIRSLRPYFMTREGIVPGKDRGIMEKVTTKIIARPGYAVGGFLTNLEKKGIQVIFMKIDPATGHFATDSASAYKSAWFGDKGLERPRQIGGDGRFVIGVYGKTGADCDDLGLVELN